VKATYTQVYTAHTVRYLGLLLWTRHFTFSFKQRIVHFKSDK